LSNFPQGDWSIACITPPASEPMTLAQAKAALRVDADLTDDDDFIGNILLPAARGYLELAYDIKIMPQTWELTLSQFPRWDRIRIPFGPVQSFAYFKYEDTGGNVQTLSMGKTGSGGDTAYQILTRTARKPAELVLPFGHVWPAVVLQTADPIRIGINYGYLTGASPETLPMPASLLWAMSLLIDHGYNNRSAVTVGTLNVSKAIELGVSNLMSVLGFMSY
jgi:uncharacterized phiE125 gp8 family phage protein